MKSGRNWASAMESTKDSAPALHFISRSTCLVTPATPSAAKDTHLALSCLDAIAVSIYTPVILIYNPPGEHHRFSTIVGALKESLSKALVEFYPFAGRLVKGADGVLEVRCDDSGAFFSEVVVEEELGEVNGKEVFPRQITGMDGAGLGGGYWFPSEQFPDLPTLVIQVTLFRCGAIILTTNWHHQVCDGLSGMNFLKAWSELAQGHPISNPPDHRRYLLAGRNPPQPPDVPPYGYSMPSEFSEPKVTHTREQSKEVHITITREDILQLKKHAAEGNTQGSFTSAECVSAHLWRAITKARGLSRDITTHLFSVVDARKRIQDFPLTYFGNCILVSQSDCSVAEVLDKPFREIVDLVHGGISRITDEYVWSLVDWINAVGPSKGHRDRTWFGLHDIQPSFWTHFPIYDLDYGFGKPVFGGRNSDGMGGAGFIIIYPHELRDGSMRVSAFLPPAAAEALTAILNL